MSDTNTQVRLRPVIRVFVSSTFSDMKHERNALQEHVFPRLEERCQRQGFQFQAIDLRWGVSTEAGLDHRAMRICFEELRRAQEISPEPNFLILLGDRYGWRPLPEAISHPEFEALATAASTGGEKQTPLPGAHGKTALQILEDWYRCDENVVLPGLPETDPDRAPLNYLLQPRTQNVRNGRDYKRRTDDPRMDAQDWLDVQEVLWRLINAAFPAKGRQWFREVNWPQHVADVNDQLHPKRAIPQIARFQASATEQEIWCGALSAANAETHVIACFREITNRNDFSAAETKDFFDVVDGAFDVVSAQRKSDLKAAVELRLGENKPLPISFSKLKRENGNVIVDASEADTRAFCDAVLERIRPIIERQIEEYWDKSERGSPGRAKRELKIEQDEHERFGRERGSKESFVGRDTELEAIRNWLGDNNRWPLVVHGSSGCGKTALMWRAFEDIPQTQKPIIRLIGTTPHSSDLRSLLTNLCQELRQRNLREGEIPTEIKELRDEFSQHLQAATPEQPLILFLDALDQLADVDNGRLLNWLPPGSLPTHVKLVVSCLSDRATGDPAGESYAELTRRQIPAENFINLDKLSEGEARLLLFEKWLPKAGRKVSDDQRARIEQRLASPACRQPIFLKLLFEEVQLWHSYDPAPVPGESVPALLGQLFDRLCQPTNHGPLLVNRVLGYLSASRHGLAEDEILEILFTDPEYRAKLNEATEQTRHELPPNAKRIPIALWSRLRFDLAPYLTERAAPGANVLTFYHRQVAEWVQEHLAKASGQNWHPHRRLACFFRGKADPQQNETWTGNSARALSELPYHLAKHDPEALAHLLFDFDFLQAKVTHSLAAELVRNYKNALDILPAEHPLVSSLELLREAVLLSLHVVSADEHQLASQLLARMSRSDQPEIQRLLDTARGWRGRSWLFSVRQSLHPPGTGLMQTLLGHEETVNSVDVTPDGRFAVSGSFDRTVRLWDLRSGQEIHTLHGHTASVDAVAITPDARWIVSVASDGTRIWSLEDGWTARRLDHVAMFVGIANEGRWCVLGSEDGTVQVVDLQTGTRLRTIETGYDWMHGFGVAEDGGTVLASRGIDDLALWDVRTGEELQYIIDSPLAKRIAVSAEARYAVIGSHNQTLNVWDLASRKRIHAIDNGGDINCVAVTRDGRLAVSGTGHDADEVGYHRTSEGLRPTVLRDHMDAVLVWNLQSGLKLQTLRGHTNGVNDIALTADGRHAVTGSSDATVRVWDLEPRSVWPPLPDQRFCVSAIAITADGRYAVTGFGNALYPAGGVKLRVWDLHTGNEVRTQSSPKLNVRSVAWMADDRSVVMTLDKLAGYGAVKVWNLATERMTSGPEVLARSVSINRDGSCGVIVAWGAVLIWEPLTGRVRHHIVQRSAELSEYGVISPDGRQVVTASDHTIYLWDTGKGQLIRNVGRCHEKIRAIAISSDGRRVCSLSGTNLVTIWELDSGAPISEFRGQDGHLYCVALTSDGSEVIIGGKDKTVELREASSGEIVARFTAEAAFTAVAVDPYDRTIVAGDMTGRAFILRVVRKTDFAGGSGGVVAELW